jgi:hypothetical protein
MFRFFICATILFSSLPLFAGDFVFFITSNLEGRLSLDKNNPDITMNILQALYREREGKLPVVFIDAGNAFHPGSLSRYSYGSVMYDYLFINGCSASVVSSHDLRLGIDSLNQLDKNGIIISANIRKGKSPAFKPYTIVNAGGNKIAITGITSESAVIDIAEQNITSIEIESYTKALDRVTAEIEKKEKCDAVILISGLSTEKNAALLRKYRNISLIISGGDSTGEVYGTPAEQIVFPDGRRILLADRKSGYYRAECSFSGSLNVQKFSFIKPKESSVSAEQYRQFENRLNLWRDRYKSDETTVFDKKRPFKTELTQEKTADLMRDYFRTEIGIVRRDSFTPFQINQSSTNFSITRDISDDFFIYTFKLKGADIEHAEKQYPRLIFKGYSDERVQGRKINKEREYTVSATQSVYEFFLKEDIAANNLKNRWLSIPDLVIKDLKERAVLKLSDYGYLDSRFTLLFSMSLKNMFSSENVSKSDGTVPVGSSSESSHLWGIDDSASLIIVNNLHRFSFLPSICLSKETTNGQEPYYPSNIMKGIFVYQMNLSDTVQPYHKSQYESLVRKVEDKRTAILRETAGIDIETKYMTGKAGIGFEKKYHDTVTDPAYGLECTISVSIPFLERFTYACTLDSFVTHSGQEAQNYYRYNLSNSLSYQLGNYISLTSQHKYYRYRDLGKDTTYSSRIFSMSLDIMTDFKVF